MGCAACVRGRNVEEPMKTGSLLVIQTLQEELKKVHPSQLVKDDSFERLWKTVAIYCDERQKKNIGRRREPEEENDSDIVIRNPDMTACKWKLLVLCRGPDFYEKQQDCLNILLKHECFSQIDKDVHRTFPEQPMFQTEEGLEKLRRCLQRTSLYFPHFGYTQGLNFIMGYLMLKKFNEMQVFWFTVHLALSQRHLMLGLFQDGFPLATLYCRFFKILLKKMQPKLFLKLAELGVSDEIWIFKWFLTYFLYSFPKEVVETVWDITFTRGGIGQIYFAYAITEQIRHHLMQCSDDSQVAAFISTLRDPTTFNELIRTEECVARCYQLRLEDIEIATEAKIFEEQTKSGSFYVKFFCNYGNQEEQVRLLADWHAKLKNQRVEFKNKQLENLRCSSQHSKRKRQSKFRVKNQERKLERLKSVQISESLISNASVIIQDIGSVCQDQPPNISRILSQSHHSQQNSEESVVQVSMDTQRSEKKLGDRQADCRMNASVHIIAAAVPKIHHENEEIEIFGLKNKPISFKKKKICQNSIQQKILKKSSIAKKNPSLLSNMVEREALHTIDNQDRSVVEFQASSGVVESVSDKKGATKSNDISESIKVISLDGRSITHSIEIESVR